MNKTLSVLALICSLLLFACSSADKDSNTSSGAVPKLDQVKADETLNRWVISEETKASEVLNLPGGGEGGLSRTRIINLNNVGNKAEASFNFQTMALFLEGNEVKSFSGSGNAVFEHKNGKWYLMKVTSKPANFERDNLMVEVK